MSLPMTEWDINYSTIQYHVLPASYYAEETIVRVNLVKRHGHMFNTDGLYMCTAILKPAHIPPNKKTTVRVMCRIEFDYPFSQKSARAWVSEHSRWIDCRRGEVINK